MDWHGWAIAVFLVLDFGIPAVTKGCLLEDRGAQNIHSLDGSENHPFVTPGI